MTFSRVRCGYCSALFPLSNEFLAQYEQEKIPFVCSICLSDFRPKQVFVKFTDSEYPALMISMLPELESIAFFQGLEAWRIPKREISQLVREASNEDEPLIISSSTIPESSADEFDSTDSLQQETESIRSGKRQKIQSYSSSPINFYKNKKISNDNSIVKTLVGGMVFKVFDGIEYRGAITIDKARDEVQIRYSDDDREVSSLLDCLLEISFGVLRHSNAEFFQGSKIIFGTENDDSHPKAQANSFFAKRLPIQEVEKRVEIDIISDTLVSETKTNEQGNIDPLQRECTVVETVNMMISNYPDQIVEEYDVYDLMTGVFIEKVSFTQKQLDSQLDLSHRSKRYISLFEPFGFKEDSENPIVLAFHLRQFFTVIYRDVTGARTSTFLCSTKKFQLFPTSDIEIQEFFEVIQEDPPQLFLQRIMLIKQWFDPYSGTRNIEKQVKDYIPGSTFINNDFDPLKHSDFKFDSLFYKNFEIFTKDGTLPRNVFTSPPFEAMDLALGLLCHYFDNIIIHCPARYHANAKKLNFLMKLAKTRDVIAIVLGTKGSNSFNNEFLCVFKEKLIPLSHVIAVAETRF